MTDIMEEMSPIERILHCEGECYVYKVPPLRSASGHRAEDWNLAAPLFTGCLKVFQADTKLRIAVYSYKDPKVAITTDDNLNIFGECPVEVKPGDNILTFVDSVIDSSRYYVLRIKDPKSVRTTSLGIGFRERENAFDFKNTLNEYVRYVNRMDLASQMANLVVTEDSGHESDGGGSGGKTGKVISPGSDPHHLAQHINPLKEGEKIKIAFKSKHASVHKDEDSTGTGTSKPKGAFSLKPPPPPGSTVFASLPVLSLRDSSVPSPNTDNSSITSNDRLSLSETTGGVTEKGTAQDVSANGDDDDWGDFSSS